MAYPNRKYSGITNAQKALLHKAKNDLEMDEETYRTMLKNITGVRSSLDLTPGGFLAVMRHLTTIGFAKKHGPYKFTGYTARLKKWQALGQRPGMASAAQLARIETDWEWMLWYWAPKGFANMEVALRAFVGRVAGVNDLRFLDRAKAIQVITAIEHTKANRKQ